MTAVGRLDASQRGALFVVFEAFAMAFDMSCSFVSPMSRVVSIIAGCTFAGRPFLLSSKHRLFLPPVVRVCRVLSLTTVGGSFFEFPGLLHASMPRFAEAVIAGHPPTMVSVFIGLS